MSLCRIARAGKMSEVGASLWISLTINFIKRFCYVQSSNNVLSVDSKYAFNLDDRLKYL